MAKRYRLAVINSHPIQYFAPLYRQIAQTPDIDITVYYCSRQGLDPGFVDGGFGKQVVWDIPLLDGYRHRFLPNLWGDRGVSGFFSLCNFSIIRELSRERYDAILIHGHNAVSNLMALGAARFVGTRVFIRGETHLGLKRSAIKRAIRRPLMTWFYTLCDACLYIGSRNKEFYLAHGVPQNKLFPVPYAVDNAAFFARCQSAIPLRNELRRRLGIEEDLPIVLYASKLTQRKRPRDLLLAYARLVRAGVSCALVFVGDGEERESLEREAASLGLPRTVFVGFVNQSEMSTYFSLADIFVLPSENEPWGLIVNEAMACGVPVVTTSEVGAAADLVADGNTGFTYKVGDTEELARIIHTLLRDRETRLTIGENCRNRIATWSYAECVDGIRQAFAAAVA